MELGMTNELEDKIVKAAIAHIKWQEKIKINDQIQTMVKLRSATSELINLDLIYNLYVKKQSLLVAFREYDMDPTEFSKEGLLTLLGWLGEDREISSLNKKELLKIVKNYYN